MTSEELTAKLEELRTLLTQRLEEIEDNPKWADEDHREELVELLNDIGDQIEALSEALQAASDGD